MFYIDSLILLSNLGVGFTVNWRLVQFIAKKSFIGDFSCNVKTIFFTLRFRKLINS
jgi:hypothetical protein